MIWPEDTGASASGFAAAPSFLQGLPCALCHMLGSIIMGRVLLSPTG